MKLRYLVSAHRVLMLYIYTKFHENVQRVSALLSRHEIMTYGQTDRRTDGQTDGQGDFYRASADSVRPLQSYWWMDGWMDGWMTCDFTSFSTVFQSYQDDGRLIMEDCVQWNSAYQSYWTDTISWQNLQRGIIPLKYRWRYGTVVTEHFLIMQYICTKFCENISKRLCAI